MRKSCLRYLAGVALTGSAVAALGAQQPAPTAPPAAPVGPAVGEMAPDFEFTGITRYGMLGSKTKLSDYRGQTVVLAFFPKARTKG